jgi:serine/threonine protein kinase
LQPEKIGRYVILRTLGRGAMGVVYLARDPQIERELALKTIRFDDAEKSFSADEAKARFLKEAKISGRLQHPHIVTVFDVGEDGGMLYLAMELVQGGSFSQRLADPAGFAMRDRVRVVAEVAEALAHAHERGVLHRDIKPANILLTPSLSAKVTDFGIGKLLTGDTELTSTGQMVGSPAYMSPEQIKGDKLDARTDIFSLGVVLYQAVTLRKPFPADTLTTLVYQILHEEPADPAVVAGDLPEGLGAIVRRCLAKDRANRYTDAGELADDLRGALGFSPVGSTANYSDSRMKHVRSSPSAPAIPPPSGPSGGSSMAPTAAMPIAAPGPAGAAPLPVTTPIPVPDSESPTITTGRRMGELAAKAGPKAPPPAGKKGVSPAVLGAALLAAVVAVVGGVFLAKRGGSSDGKADAPPEPAATSSAAPASTAAAPAAPAFTAAAPASPAATAGPAVAVVETPAAGGGPSTASERAAAKKPVHAKKAETEGAAAPSSSSAKPVATPKPAAKPAVKPADLTVTIRRFLKINVSPSQARVFLDGDYIGISDDWDDAGGGSLLTFNLEGQHRIRICYPEHRDLLVDVVVRATSTDDKVTIEQDLPKGTPDGPTGPDGDFHRPNYKTVGAVVFNVVPPDAMISVNGKEYGPASKWAKDEMMFPDMAVYQIGLAAPGYEPKTVRLMVAPTAGQVRATIKEKLKKQ